MAMNCERVLPGDYVWIRGKRGLRKFCEQVSRRTRTQLIFEGVYARRFRRMDGTEIGFLGDEIVGTASREESISYDLELESWAVHERLLEEEERGLRALHVTMPVELRRQGNTYRLEIAALSAMQVKQLIATLKGTR